MTNKNLPKTVDRIVFSATTGSHSHGTNTETSDLDVRGIYMSPLSVIYSPFEYKGVVEGEGYVDGVKDFSMFEMRKFLKLMMDQNPSILEMLWIDDKFIRTFSPEYGAIRAKRDLLLSKKSGYTFLGYAQAQMKRLQNHKDCIEDPQPKRRPKEIDFLERIGKDTSPIPLTGHKLVIFKFPDLFYLVECPGACVHDKHEALVCEPKYVLPAGVDYPLVWFNKEHYKTKLALWEKFWNNKNTRNSVRAELEVKFGYDTKHASHVIRLLRMGKEILTEAKVKVFRPDAEYLLSIKQGKVPFKELMEEAESLKERVEGLIKTSSLRDEVNAELVETLSYDIHRKYWASLV